jgi:phospholipid/cholesterol/gamma-HCH transport system substrate-binding protein
MARRVWTTELKVGAFVITFGALLVTGYMWAYDGLRGDESSYTVSVLVPSADGLYKGSLVKIAGVDVGAINTVKVEGEQARLVLGVRSAYPIPTDTKASLRASGMLGDRYVGLDLGVAETIVPDGGEIDLTAPPPDLDELTRQADVITENVAAITARVREVVENDANKENLEATIANVQALSAELRVMANENRAELAAIVDSLGRLTVSLEHFSTETSADIDEELEAIKKATEKLDATLENVESITGKIDDGEGSLGALVNDDTTVANLNATMENANATLDSTKGIWADAYYLGRVFVGSQPSDPVFVDGNPVAPLHGDAQDVGYAGSNNLGFELHHPSDLWAVFEINDYPQGTISQEEHFLPGQDETFTEYTEKLKYRFTFQMAKRWWDVSFRLGIKESGGGVGVTGYLLRNRLTLSADAFNFALGSYPAVDDAGLPNLRLAARLEPVPRLWLEAGAEQVLLGARYGYFTGFVSAGLHLSTRGLER